VELFPPHVVIHDRPAGEWLEATPIGNGRLGAMVFGGIAEDLLPLNDDTLYSGGPEIRAFTPRIEAADFAAVRRLFAEGRYREAETIIGSRWLGTTHTSYQPAGTLALHCEHPADISDYQRELRLAEGLCALSYTCAGIRYRREYFASHPADAIVVRLGADSPGQINLTAALSTPHPHGALSFTDEGLTLSGRLPVLALKRSLAAIQKLGDAWKYPGLFEPDDSPRPGAATLRYEAGPKARGMRFAIAARIFVSGGELAQTENGWRVRKADHAFLALSIGSSFAGYDRSPSRECVDPEEKPRRAIAALSPDYASLRSAHASDFGALFGRMDLRLGSEGDSEAPVETRQEKFARGEDPGLAALHFQFARYLMISASREGTQAMNLQGLWNPHLVPPWNGAYTLNINTPMNYWIAEAANLPECHRPLLALTGEAAVNGRRLARQMFGRPGWVCFHHIGLWRDVQPSDGQVCWAFWPMAQAWLCRHVWESFVYDGDLSRLRETGYPLLRDAAEFLLAWLVEDEEGYLVTPAGVSPENSFLFRDPAGTMQRASAAPGPTMDIALTRDLFANCLRAAQLLGLDQNLQERLSEALPRLAPFRIGRRGQLQEWREDFAEAEPDHRHVSHLYGLYPARQVDGRPDLLAAARRSLELRGDQSTGWSTAWKIALWARLGDGEHAFRLLRQLLGRDYCRSSLLNADPHFQIDANFGTAAGLLEMLASHNGETVFLLPALPREFSEGAIRGLRAPGGFELDFSWSRSCLQSLRVHSIQGSGFSVRTARGHARFATSAGASYELGRDFTFSLPDSSS